MGTIIKDSGLKTKRTDMDSFTMQRIRKYSKDSLEKMREMERVHFTKLMALKLQGHGREIKL